MGTIQPIAPLPKIIATLDQGPLVLVSVKQWNAAAQLIQTLQAQVEELRAYASQQALIEYDLTRQRLEDTRPDIDFADFMADVIERDAVHA